MYTYDLFSFIEVEAERAPQQPVTELIIRML